MGASVRLAGGRSYPSHSTAQVWLPRRKRGSPAQSGDLPMQPHAGHRRVRDDTRHRTRRIRASASRKCGRQSHGRRRAARRICLPAHTHTQAHKHTHTHTHMYTHGHVRWPAHCTRSSSALRPLLIAALSAVRKRTHVRSHRNDTCAHTSRAHRHAAMRSSTSHPPPTPSAARAHARQRCA